MMEKQAIFKKPTLNEFLKSQRKDHQEKRQRIKEIKRTEVLLIQEK